MAGDRKPEGEGKGSSGGRLRGFIKKPQVLATRGSKDSVKTLLSKVSVDTSLPGRLLLLTGNVQAEVETANNLFKPEIIQDLVDETGADGVQKRFAVLALKTARDQLGSYKRQLEERERKHGEIRTALDRTRATLEEEQAPMLKFLAKHAPADQGVVKANEDLRKFTADLEVVGRGLDSLGALIASSLEKERRLEAALDRASKAVL